MAEASASKSGADSDQDFEPSEEMLVNDSDDEQTLEEEEALESADSVSNELDELQREGEMPLNEVLAMYGIETSVENEDTFQKDCEQDGDSELLETSEQRMESHGLPHSIRNHPVNSAESDSCLSEERALEAVCQQSRATDSESNEDEENYSPDEEEDEGREEEYEYLQTVSNRYVKKAKSTCKFVYITKEEYDEAIRQQQSASAGPERDNDHSSDVDWDEDNVEYVKTERNLYIKKSKSNGKFKYITQEEYDEAIRQQQSASAGPERDNDHSSDVWDKDNVEYMNTERNVYMKKLKRNGKVKYISKEEYDEGIRQQQSASAGPKRDNDHSSDWDEDNVEYVKTERNYIKKSKRNGEFKYITKAEYDEGMEKKATK